MAWSYLPEDTVIHILSRLPVKCLLRLKCVCKSWCALLQSPNFIAQHLNHSSFNTYNNSGISPLIIKRTYVVMDFYEEVEDKDSFFMVSGENFEVTLDLDLPYFKDELKVNLEMVGFCNGVICLRSFKRDYGEIFLWNPATRAFRALPESLVPLVLNPISLNMISSDVGFGFDVKTNDYKVVRVVNGVYVTDRIWKGNPHAEVYSLSSDSWRLIDEDLPPLHTYSYDGCSAVYLNGIYFWWATHIDERDEVMLSFDMSHEVFRTTPLPADVYTVDPREIRGKNFVVLNESVSLVVFPHSEMEKCFEKWVLRSLGLNYIPFGALQNTCFL